MTVERCSGPGTGTWTSDTYSCKVNGTSNYVYQWNTALKTSISSEGNFNDAMKKCIVKWGADESVTLEVTLLSGAITSYEICTHFDDVTATISAGKLNITVPAGRKFRLHINGNKLKPLFVLAGPLEPAIPSGSVTFAAFMAANPGATSCPSGTKIHFPTGEHTVTAGFLVGDNSTIHISRNAIVDSRWSLVDSTGVVFQGTGVHQNSSVDPESVWTLALGGASEADLSIYSPYSAYTGQFTTDTIIRGITHFATCFRITGGVSKIEDSDFIQYSRGGLGDGPVVRPGLVNLQSYLTRCFVDAADDAVFLTNSQGNCTISDCVIGTAVNSTVHCGYWAYERLCVQLMTGCHLYHLGIADNNTESGYPSIGDNTVIASRVDATDEQAADEWGHSDVTFEDCTVYGTILSRGIFLRNEPYPYDTNLSRDTAGNITNWRFVRVNFKNAPGQGSLIIGRDRNNTPNNISFEDCEIAGVKLTARNFRDYFTISSSCYRITVDGHPV